MDSSPSETPDPEPVLGTLPGGRPNRSMVGTAAGRLEVRGPAGGSWRVWSETRDGAAWTALEEEAADGTRGQAWAPTTSGLHEAIDARLQLPLDGGEADSRPRDRVEATARGLVASARIAVICRRHQVPLHLWMGGAIRPAVRGVLPLVVRGRNRAERDEEVRRAASRLGRAFDAVGRMSVAVHDQSTEVALIAQSVAAIRAEIGAGPGLTLRLGGQLTLAQTRELAAAIRGADIVCIADPCATLTEAIDATRDALPALGLSAERYPREAIFQCLVASPPAVLFIDPLVEGGPVAVRGLAAPARVLQVEVCLTAEDGGAWLVDLCTQLAAVIPACHQPMTLPLDWTVDSLRAAGIEGGALPLPTGPPALTSGRDTSSGLNGAERPMLP